MSQQTENEEIKEVAIIARAEAERRRRGVISVSIGLVLTVIGIGAVGALFQAGALGPELDMEEEEKDSLEETNDPQCRAMIAELTTFGDDLRADMPELEYVIHADKEKVAAARAKVSSWRERLETSRVKSREANLRFEGSRKELDTWFDYVDTELRLLDLRGERHLERLAAEAKGEAYVEIEPKKRRGKIIGKKEKVKRTPEQKRDAALLAINDALESFRVWHSSAMHPCGAADEGETPWAPVAAPVK